MTAAIGATCGRSAGSTPVCLLVTKSPTSGGCTGCRVVTRQPVQPPEVGDLVTSRHTGVEPALLPHVAPMAAVIFAHGLIVVPHLAAVGSQHSEQDPQQGRLSRPVRSQQPGDHPGRDVEAHCVEGQPVAEGACDIVNLQPHGATLLNLRGVSSDLSGLLL